MSAKKQADKDESRRPAATADDVAVAPSIMILATLLKRSGNIVYQSELGLSSIAWRVIARLGDQGPMTHTELAEFAQFDKGQLSRTAAQLVVDGLVTRHRRTWRSIELRLTPKGLKLFAALKEISRTRHDALTADLGPRELKIFREALDKMIDNARRMLRQLEGDGSDGT